MRSTFHGLRGLGADPASPATTPPIAEALPAILSTVQSLTTKDAREEVGVLEARIKNYQDMKRRFPNLAFFYENEIRKLYARLDAARARAQLQAEGEQATRDWRWFGYLISAGAAVVTVAVAANLLKDVEK